METLTLEETFDKCQECGIMHQYTCGNDSKHSPLKYNEKKQRLYCVDCSYTQAFEKEKVKVLDELTRWAVAREKFR
ncbi:MAG: hypothetical protein RR623_07560 [Bacilli bacterium]